MALYNQDGVWYVWDGRYKGKTLADAIKNGTHAGLGMLAFYCHDDGQGDIFEAEEQRQRTWFDSCMKCGMRTEHNDQGCLECAAYDKESNVQ